MKRERERVDEDKGILHLRDIDFEGIKEDEDELLFMSKRFIW